jgi:hypothetical protein
MPFVEEVNGVCYAVEYGPGCDDCWGLGAVFAHTPSCGSDLCVGNGDEHSCLGSWLPCDTCGTMEKIR